MSESSAYKDEGNALFTNGSDVFPAIPLEDADAAGSAKPIVGLVRDASTQITSLIHSEIELAKAEMAASAKRGAIGGALFAVAGTIALFSSFFFFFALAELLALWTPRWVAFGIVFLIILVVAVLFVLIGWKQVKKLRLPQATIDSVTKLPEVIPGKKKSSEGFYTN